MSQLDLALAADVSARHISFLESGRAKPSQDMVLRLMSTLQVPLRDQNDVLLAADFAARFLEPALSDIAPAIDDAITRMMRQQEPYPLTVLNPWYDILRSNQAAQTIFSQFVLEPARLKMPLNTPLNLYTLIFDPQLARPFIQNWQQIGRSMMARLHREALSKSNDGRLWALLEQVLAYPDVPQDWRQPDFSDALAEKAVQLVFGYLIDCHREGSNVLAREKMHNASCIAGMAFTNASLGITHSLAHALGGVFHVPHGRANAILMAQVVAFNADLEGSCDTEAAKRYASLAKNLSLPSSSVREGVESLIVAINVLKDEMNMPKGIQATGVSEIDFNTRLREMVGQALRDSCTPTNPRDVNEKQLETLYRNAF